ncbi:hypothetical protein LTR85_000295 [Meristemomyces frigidus]|nr:hypothetical protein LTR85_000295 [Meristemomyces frigidus]
MPTATRRQAHTRSRNQGSGEPMVEITSDDLPTQNVPEDMEPDQAMEDEGLDEVEEEDDDEVGGDEDDEPEPECFPPPGLKEISSLASWTVSTAKPGNGVAALRSPDLAHFWQSDGPQPHLLSIHFFKLVSIVSIRVFLDFDNDESYTPTKIALSAGMSVHDVQEFAEMEFKDPNGWHEVDFSNVGLVDPDDDSEQEEDQHRDVDWSKRPVLKAFLVQVRILENHQNGKDTHLRAVQLFARDDAHQQTRKITRPEKPAALPTRNLFQQKVTKAEPNNLKMAPWMLEPDLR